MRGCEWLFDEPQAQAWRHVMGCESVDDPGPCRSGRRCPILPETLGVMPQPSRQMHAVRMDAAS